MNLWRCRGEQTQEERARRAPTPLPAIEHGGSEIKQRRAPKRNQILRPDFSARDNGARRKRSERHGHPSRAPARYPANGREGQDDGCRIKECDRPNQRRRVSKKALNARKEIQK